MQVFLGLHRLPLTVCCLRDYNGVMEALQHMTVRDIRKKAPGRARMWVAVESGTGGAYTVRRGDVELCTINGRKSRVFRSLDAVKQALKEELGITEFKVKAARN